MVPTPTEQDQPKKAQTAPELLARCLDEIRSGEASWAECQAQPEVKAAGLGPLLDIAAQMERFPSLAPGPACLAHIRERLAERKRRRPVLRWAWALLAVLVALLTLGGTAWAASESLPGQPLYPFKRWGERVRLSWMRDAEARSTFLMELAERRLDEARRVCSTPQCPDWLLADLEQQTEAAAAEIERVSESRRPLLLARLVELTGRQQAVLEEVLERAPEAARAGLQRALERSRQGHERAFKALEKHRPTPPAREGNPPGLERQEAPTPHHSPGKPESPGRKASPKP